MSSAPPDTSLRRLPNTTPTTPRITPLHDYRYIVTLRCPSHTPIPTIVGSAYDVSRRVAQRLYRLNSTTRHVLSYSCAQRAAPSTIQSTIWWSGCVDVSLVLPARGCLRVGGCRCTPLVPVVVFVGFTWTGRHVMRCGTR